MPFAQPDPATNPAYPDPIRPYVTALHRLAARAGERLFRFLDPAGRPIPPATPSEARIQSRANGLAEWVHALCRVMAGDPSYIRNWRMPRSRIPGFRDMVNAMRVQFGKKPFADRKKPTTPKPQATEESRARARRAYMLRVFARQPVATIATRLARRLGIKPTDKAWPTDLLDITETPRAWALKRYHPFLKLKAEILQRLARNQAQAPPGPAPAEPNSPPYHPRE
jgi:hypothetical protein